VLRFRAAADAERRIDAIFEHYRRRDVPFFWLVHPTARPSDLGERLRARGLEEAAVVPGMAMDLRELEEPAAPPSGIEIREATTSDTETVLEMVAWHGVRAWRGCSRSTPFTLHETPATRSGSFTPRPWP